MGNRDRANNFDRINDAFATHQGAYMKWRYHIYGKDNHIIKISDYLYDTEHSALEAAADYVRNRVPRDEVWHSVASHQ